MVKKLFKHEFIAYIRTLLPVYIVMVGVAALTRFVFFFEADTTAFGIIGVSSIIAFVIACLACLFMTFVQVITRFYKNLFTNEGYLSFTLPVTSAQHIWVKVITGVCSVVLAFILILGSLCIATAGEMTVEIFKVVVYLVKHIAPLFEGHFWFYFAEVLLGVVVSLFVSILLYYTCIAIGQLTRKNRALAAVGVYFGYYFLTQIISTIMIVVFSMISYSDWFNKFMETVEKNAYAWMHVFILGSILLTALMGALYFFITHRIITKKLNLE